MAEELYVPGFTTLTKEQARAIVEFGNTEEYLIAIVNGNSQPLGGGGTNALPEQLPGEVDAPHHRVFSWSQSGELVPAIMPLGEFDGGINIDPALAFGKELATLLGAGTKLVIVQCAQGGTSFYGSPSNWNKGDAAYEDAVARANAALAALPNSRIICTITSLGDLEGAVEEDADGFEALALQYIDDWRSDVGPDLTGSSQTMPMVFCTVRNGTYKETINTAIRNLPKNRNAVAVAEGEDLPNQATEEGGADTVHLGPLARREFGRRWARAYWQALAVAPQNRPYTDEEIDARMTLASDLASHVGAGGAVHPNAVAAGAAGFMSGADKTKLDGVASGAQVNLLESVSNLGAGAAIFESIVAKAARLKSLTGINLQFTVSGTEIGIVPFPALPAEAFRMNAAGSTGTKAEVVVVAGTASPTIALNVNVLGADGDARGPVLGFSGTGPDGAIGNAINIGGYSIPNGSYTILVWLNPGLIPAGARLDICGSQAGSGGWQFSLEKNVDKLELFSNHVEDVTGVRGATPIYAGRWIHAAQVYNYSGSTNGILMNVLNGVYQHSRNFPRPTDRTVQIGSRNNSVNYRGGMYKLTFVDSAMTLRQIQRHMYQTAEELYGFGGLL